MENLNYAVDLLKKFSGTSHTIVDKKQIDYVESELRQEEFYRSDLPRILVLGKFKSGKSTLINALMGRNLAAVDVLEKTAWIARYWPAEEEFCNIEFKDGSVEQTDVALFVHHTEHDDYEESYLESIRRIDVGYLADGVKDAFIDTPGFGSTNEENEKRALEAVKDADLVMYVTDINKIGDMRENAMIGELRKSQIPMICVASKYDGGIAHNKSEEEAKSMVAKYTGFSENEIFVLSVKNYRKNKPDSVEMMEKLKLRLTDISVRNQLYRKNAGKAKLFRLENHMIRLFREMESELYKAQRLRIQFENNYRYNQRRVESGLCSYIQSYVEETLYQEYKERLIEMMTSLVNSDSRVDVVEMASQILPEDYMERYWEQLIHVIADKMNELWSSRLGADVGNEDEISRMFEDCMITDNMTMDNMRNLLNFGHDQEMADKGVKLSFGIAGIASFYQAVLGANAASIALTGAAFSTGIPVAVLGIGLTNILISKRRQQRRESTDIRMGLEQNIKDFAGIILQHCMARLEQIEDAILARNLASIDSETAKSLPEDMSLGEALEQTGKVLLYMEEEVQSIHFEDCSADHVTAELEKLRRSYEKCKNEFTRGQIERDDLRNRLEEIDDKKKKLEKELQNANDCIERGEKRIELLNADLLESQKQVELVGKTLTEKNTELNHAKQTIREDSEMLAKAYSDLRDAEKQGFADRNKVSQLEQEVRDRKKKLEESKKIASGLQSRVSTLERDGKKYKDQIAGTRSQVAKTEKMLETERKKYQESQQLLKDVRHKLEEREREVHQNKEELKILSGKYEQMRRELENSSAGNEQKLTDYEEKMLQIEKDLSEFAYLGSNKLRLSELSQERSTFEPLILLEEENYRTFLEDLKNLLKNGLDAFKGCSAKELVKLINQRYILTRNNQFRLYFGLEDYNTLGINYIESYVYSGEKYRKYCKCFVRTFSLSDDQIRYKIFDMIHCAKNEILIESPWFLSKAWENKNRYGLSLKEEITSAIQKNPKLSLKVLTGMDFSEESRGVSDKKSDNEKTVEMVDENNLAFQAYGSRVHFYKHCCVHDKIMIVDNTVALVGSYNILSNQGIYQESHRTGETMEILLNPLNVENRRAETYRRANMSSGYVPL